MFRQAWPTVVTSPFSQIPDRTAMSLVAFTRNTYFTNVSSDVKQVISLHGKSSSVNINGVHFKNLKIQGKAITSQTDSNASWDINSYVSNITFQ